MFRFSKSITIPILFILLLIPPSLALAQHFKVTRVLDGDTLKAENQGYTITIRLVGIDAPETFRKKGEAGQLRSQKSKKHLMRLVLDKMVEIEGYGLDRYSRDLAVVFLDDENANLEIVKSGLAEVYRGKPAKGFNTEPFWKREAKAKKTGVGIWSLGDKFISPRKLRTMRK